MSLRFSLSRLLASMTLIAIGLGMFFWATRLDGKLGIAAGFMSLPLVSAGVGNLFHRAGTGALLGLLLLFALLAIVSLWSMQFTH